MAESNAAIGDEPVATARNPFSISLRSLLITVTLLSVGLACYRLVPWPKEDRWSGTLVQDLRHFEGKIQLDGTRENIRTRYVVDEATWISLWQSLGETTTRPTVDFSSEIVLVGISPDANHVYNEGRLSSWGNLRSDQSQTLMYDGNPKFGRYTVNVISNEGVWMIEGSPYARRWPVLAVLVGLLLVGLFGVVVLVNTALPRLWALRKGTAQKAAESGLGPSK